MTKAAAELGVTHGAISRQVKSLEAQLGARLVHGRRHELELTPAGRDLAAAASAAFDLIAGALPGNSDETEEIVLSCLGPLAMKWLIPRLPEFLSANPGLRVRIVESHEAVDFSQGGLHSAIRIAGNERQSGVSSTSFMAHFHGPVVLPALMAKAGADQRILLSLPRLHSATFRTAWSTWVSRAGVVLPAAPIEHEFEHNSYMLEACDAGLGIAVAPWAFAAADVDKGRLAAPFGFEPVEERYVYLRPRLSSNPAAERLGDWLVQVGRAAAPPPRAMRLSV